MLINLPTFCYIKSFSNLDIFREPYFHKAMFYQSSTIHCWNKKNAVDETHVKQSPVSGFSHL